MTCIMCIMSIMEVCIMCIMTCTMHNNSLLYIAMCKPRSCTELVSDNAYDCHVISQVGFAEQQVQYSRFHRSSYSPPTDPKWSQQWSLVS